MFEPAIGSTYAILRESASLTMTMGAEAIRQRVGERHGLWCVSS